VSARPEYLASIVAVSGTWFDQDTDEIGMETLESYGELSSGRVYNNEYHMLLTIRGEDQRGA